MFKLKFLKRKGKRDDLEGQNLIFDRQQQLGLMLTFVLFLQTSKTMGCAFTPQARGNSRVDDGRRGRLTTIDCRRRSTRAVDIILENVKMVSENLTQEQISFCMKHLREHQLFNGLSEDELKAVCQKMVWMEGEKDQYLFQQGEMGHSFFLIEKGKVSVEIDGKKVTEMKEGQAFGELALLFRAVRAASIKCQTSVTRFFVMKPALYRNILQQLKTAEYSRNKQVIQKLSLFQCLTNKQKYSLANSIKQVKFKSEQVIFQAGQVSQGVYIISHGHVEITMKGKEPIILSKLEIFGQSALKDDGRRQGQAKCIEDTTCLVIGKKDIEKSLGSNSRNLVYFSLQKWALLRVQTFKKYSNSELNNIIMGFQIIYKEQGQKINGADYRGLVVALQGGIDKQPEGTLFNMKKCAKGEWEGENHVKNQSGYIGYLSFEKLSDIINDIESKQILLRASEKCIEGKDNTLTLYDFNVVRKLGEGQFGQVFLVQNKKTGGALCAVKCLSKKAVREQQMELSVIEQKKILQKAIFPYIVGYVKTYHDTSNIFLLMQYIRGKEMFDVIRQMPTLNKPIARYYFGCIMISLEYLHANSIIYRDIKPENSVVDHHGKAYLIDMGTAKQLTSANMFKTFTIIGTPHYMAPEVFEGKGYSFESDYWSLGILLYEFICGKLPFGENLHNDPYALYGLIRKGMIEFPKYVNDQKVKKLINFLLIKDPKQRSLQVSFEKIKKHEYFDGFSWKDLIEERILPPYIPRDFRLGTEQSIQSTGVSFLAHFYKQKDSGKVQEWNENIGI